MERSRNFKEEDAHSYANSKKPLSLTRSMSMLPPLFKFKTTLTTMDAMDAPGNRLCVNSFKNGARQLYKGPWKKGSASGVISMGQPHRA